MSKQHPLDTPMAAQLAALYTVAPDAVFALDLDADGFYDLTVFGTPAGKVSAVDKKLSRAFAAVIKEIELAMDVRAND